MSELKTSLGHGSRTRRTRIQAGSCSRAVYRRGGRALGGESLVELGPGSLGTPSLLGAAKWTRLGHVVKRLPTRSACRHVSVWANWWPVLNEYYVSLIVSQRKIKEEALGGGCEIQM
ncbi:unnamed protein product [Timema podura]|uniref:Uncharacterized protein n=1 Tax=Timema podura TaxID=61482 RepID=A0ABN7NLK0_TIMPD|nr:unnamed protein product [Timema podura]